MLNVRTVRVRFRIRVTTEIKLSPSPDDPVLKAIAELRRTLEAEGYSPEIDFLGVVP